MSPVIKRAWTVTTPGQAKKPAQKEYKSEWTPPVSGRDILNRLDGIVRSAIKDKRTVERQDWSKLSKEEAAKQKAAALHASAGEHTLALVALREDLERSRKVAQKNRHMSRFPLLGLGMEGRTSSTAEYQAGTAIASVAKGWQGVTRILTEAYRAGRVEFCFGVLDTCDARGSFQETQTIQSALEFQKIRDTILAKSGVQACDQELLVIEKADELVKNLVHVNSEGITLDLSPNTLTAIGLAGQEGGLLDQTPGVETKADPDSQVGKEQEVQRLDAELEAARAARAAEKAAEGQQ